MNHTTHTEQEMIDLGKKITTKLKGGDILLLHGELGAGKTTLTKGICQGLGIKDNITSPTFTLMNVYEVSNENIKQLVHIDTYRLENEQELFEIGIEDYLEDKDTVSIIEWPEKIKNLLKDKKTMDITIAHKNKDSRELTIQE